MYSLFNWCSVIMFRAILVTLNTIFFVNSDQMVFWCLGTILWQLVCSGLKNLGGQKIFEQKMTFFGQNGHLQMSLRGVFSKNGTLNCGGHSPPPSSFGSRIVKNDFFDKSFKVARVWLTGLLFFQKFQKFLGLEWIFW